MPSLVLLGCGTIPMGVDPLPYYSIDEKDQAIHTRELCLLYRTHGFVAKSNTCEGSWEFEHERIKSAYDTPAKEQEKVQEYKIEAVLKLKRGSEEIHEVTTSIADAGSTREEAATANMSTDEEDWIRRRNELQHTILGLATNECNEYKRSLAARSTFGVAGTSALALLVSAAAGITGGESTTQGLVAGVVALTGISSLIEDKYAGDLAPALTGIEIARTRVFRQIRRSQKKDLINYPLSRAVNDAIRYHSVCSLMEGVAEVSKSLTGELERAATGGTAPNDQTTRQEE